MSVALAAALGVGAAGASQRFGLPLWLTGLVAATVLLWQLHSGSRLTSMTEPTPIRDFTLPMEPIRFRVDEDEFAAPAIAAPAMLARFATEFSAIQELRTTAAGDLTQLPAVVGKVADLFTMLIPGPHGRRLKERLLSEGRPADPDDDPPRMEADPPPIDLLRQAYPILTLLLERWGLRPTQSSSSSPDGSPTPSEDTSSTAGASPAASDSQS